jgi:hypothetical protein
MNAMTKTTTAMAPARPRQSADLDDRVRLNRSRNAAANHAEHRPRPKRSRRYVKGRTMAVDLPKFVATAIELYELWPSLFNWAASLIIPIVIALVTASWWIGGYKADANEAALRGQIAILEQRLAFATERRSAAEREAERFRKLSDLRTQQLSSDKREPDDSCQAQAERLALPGRADAAAVVATARRI